MTLAATIAWEVPADHAAFPGHFPGQPILPGVVLLDRAILLASGALGCSAAGCRVASAKFLSPVGPGESLDFILAGQATGGVRCDVRAGGRAVAAFQLAFPGVSAA